MHRLRFHLTFIPKSAGNSVSANRKRVLEGMIAKRIEELFGEACEVMGWEIHELSVHAKVASGNFARTGPRAKVFAEQKTALLIQINPRDSVSDVSRRLKGGSMVFAPQKTAPGDP